ncbi:MAG: penicillin-binding protein 2 [Candidatus Omnitrophota bacterium]
MKDRIITGLISFLFVILLATLFYTQVIRFFYYSQMSKNNSIRIIPIDGPRGKILDRNGQVLVTSRLSFDAAIVYQELGDRERLFRAFRDTLGITDKDIEKALAKSRKKPYAPVAIVEDIDKDKAVALEESSCDIPGLEIATRSKRDYILKNSGAHIFGYISEMTENELLDMKDYGYRSGDLIGRSGVEKYYDSYLRGVDGGTQIEVDNRGKEMRSLGVKEPSSGKDIYLTIDKSIQLACDKLLGEHKGAAIVMDPRTGEILALASHPAFDPNIFVRPDTSQERLDLLRDKVGRPMSDRAISGLYPPGSVFKIVTAAAGLESNRISKNTQFTCNGSYKLGKATFDCWKKEGHGPQNIVGGLKYSCNVFFYSMGRIVGVDIIENYAKMFGFGKLTGIDLPDEVKGIAPGREWKRLYRKAVWYEGETINYAIGQGYLMVTPIQVLNMMAEVANNGTIVHPHIVKRIGDNFIPAQKSKRLDIREGTLKIIKQGLFEVVNGEHGTGARAKSEGVIAAGKTGTAENPLGKTHAWFSGFAPFDDPKICVVVFLEHGGKGGLEPAGIAGGIFKEAKDRGYL